MVALPEWKQASLFMGDLSREKRAQPPPARGAAHKTRGDKRKHTMGRGDKREGGLGGSCPEQVCQGTGGLLGLKKKKAEKMSAQLCLKLPPPPSPSLGLIMFTLG